MTIDNIAIGLTMLVVAMVAYFFYKEIITTSEILK
jgi:hypothetical protein